MSKTYNKLRNFLYETINFIKKTKKKQQKTQHVTTTTTTTTTDLCNSNLRLNYSSNKLAKNNSNLSMIVDAIAEKSRLEKVRFDAIENLNKTNSLIQNITEDERIEKIEKLFEYLNEEVEIQIESYKEHFNRLKCDLCDQVDVINANLKEIAKNKGTMNKYKKEKRLIKSLKKMRKSGVINFNDELPDDYSICFIKGPNMINLHKIRKKDFIEVDLKGLLKYPTGLCNIDDRQLAIVDNQTGEICILNTKFQVSKRINYIDKVKLNGPRGICVNDAGTKVYITDTGNDRFLISNRDFSEVERIVGKKGKHSKEFDWPTDVRFYNKCLYVLDEMNYRVQQFDEYGNFIRVLIKYNAFNMRSEIYKRMSISNDSIALMNKSNIIIYNINNGEKLQKINPNQSYVANMITFQTIYFKNEYLISTCLYDNNTLGSMKCYKIVNDENTLLFDRVNGQFDKANCDIELFDDKLVILCMRNNMLQVAA